ncbi:hypothetical protein UFOVP930_39 [uncultured Caudovirales phage]|uniref:3'-5' exonuclease n=1 Tax=uncultured Caudovirales phage TaxID=2100421 RepID=A0A6J5PSL6_9CAUD|nr:hypothetical protein UFOVP930_39 [uncultured Caudovirales phage]CAB4200174.1 hypothetical protein UFOVP1354_27 [uncultured Caudovirales phage]CAB5238487.1 hypothetical protein UFOVP1547_28 [uncultured Caudovirales phage]
MSNILIIDIETLSQPEAEIRAKLPPFDPAKVKLGVLKDPDKIRAKLAEAEAEHGNEEVREGALHATTGTLAIVGFRRGEGVKQYHVGEMTEAQMIEAAFVNILAAFDKGVIVSGFFIKGFDLPFIVQRAWLLGVKVPTRIFNAFKPRYPWSESIVCLQEVWLAGSAAQFGARVSLATVLRELGLPPKSGSGADFGAMWARSCAEALQYNANDLAVEMQLAERLI